MPIKQSIKQEIEGALESESDRELDQPNWSMSIQYIGKDKLGYKVTLENRSGLRFVFADKNVKPPDDVESLVEDYCNDVIKEIRKRRKDKKKTKPTKNRSK